MPDLLTEPGVYEDIDPDFYHRDPVEGGSLSSSGARKLLPPGCPAQYAYERANPPAPKDHFDIGHAAHKLVLGNGPAIVSIDYRDWRTKAAQAERDDVREAGHVPLLRADYEMVHAMADALRQHPIAGPLFTAGHGTPEATLVWKDKATGINCRCRLDWLPAPRSGRLIIPDYKTAAAVDLDALSKSMQTYGYHLQADWNRAGCQALELADDDAQFVLVAQSKTAPYLVTVYQPDHVAMRIGALRNHQARTIYAGCAERGVWPDHTDDVAQIPLPRWAENEWTDQL